MWTSYFLLYAVLALPTSAAKNYKAGNFQIVSDSTKTTVSCAFDEVRFSMCGLSEEEVNKAKFCTAETTATSALIIRKFSQFKGEVSTTQHADAFCLTFGGSLYYQGIVKVFVSQSGCNEEAFVNTSSIQYDVIGPCPSHKDAHSVAGINIELFLNISLVVSITCTE